MRLGKKAPLSSTWRIIVSIVIVVAFFSFVFQNVSPAQAVIYTNSFSINIPDNTTAQPYPSVINVVGQGGLITDINVTLTGLTHSHLDDLDILLESPSGQKVMLMSDACGSPDVSNINLTFDDEAGSGLPDTPGAACTSGSYKPTDFDATENLPAPAPTRPYSTSLSAFDGFNANGAWKLYIDDDTVSDSGTLTSWSMNIISRHTNSSTISISSAAGPTAGSPFPSTINVQNHGGLITDVDVTLSALNHTAPSDLDILLVGPGGQKVMLVSDACGSNDLVAITWTIDDEAANFLPAAAACPTGNYKPTNINGGDNATEIPGAPAQPYSTTLSVFDNTSPNGVWSLYVYDDANGDLGAINNGWTLTFTVTQEEIAIPATGTSGAASPNPYSYMVLGHPGLITDLNVSLTISHTAPADLDILLVSPSGDSVILMSDNCGTQDMNATTITFDDEAATTLPSGSAVCSGSYKPSNSGGGDTFTDAPAGPYGTTLSVFDGKNPNGVWRFYVMDDADGDTGFISNIAFNFQTGTSTIQIPGNLNATEGIANPYPYIINKSGLTGSITDVNLIMTGLSHNFMGDLDILLVSPSGTPVLIMSDACNNAKANDITIGFNDDLPESQALPLSGSPCGTSGDFRPANFEGDEAFYAPAPPPPYYDRLSAFDGEDPNGDWKLYIIDDTSLDTGFIRAEPQLFISTNTLTNAITNGNFSSGLNNWLEFGSGNRNVSSGVLRMQATAAGYTVFQNTPLDLPQDTPWELSFDAGNTGSIPKRLTILIWDAAFARQRACSFWLAPNQPLRNYQIVGDTAAPWTDTTVHFYPSTPSTDGYFLIDNVVFNVRTDLPSDGLTTIRETLCIDPTAPANPSTGGDSPNLLNNHDFSILPGGNANGTWALYGNITGNLSGGALRIQRTGDPAVDPAGSLLQNTDVPILNNGILEFAVDLGNSSANWQRVTILLHNESFAGLQFCTFWLAPNSPLATHVIRTYANQDWNSEGVSVSIYPSTNSQYILIDNTVLRVRPQIKVIGTGCYEPGSNRPAMDDLEMQAQLNPLQLPLLPTATPFAAYTAPGTVGEIPVIPPSAPIESSSPSEGTIGE